MSKNVKKLDKVREINLIVVIVVVVVSILCRVQTNDIRELKAPSTRRRL